MFCREESLLRLDDFDAREEAVYSTEPLGFPVKA
jgi:hypothetical protein